MGYLPALALLCTLVVAPIFGWMGWYLHRERQRSQRRATRHVNMARQKAWAFVFGKPRVQRLTDQRAPEEF